MELTILIPAKNEKNNLPVVIDEIFEIVDFKFDYEILVIIPKNDTSLDNLSKSQLDKISTQFQKNDGYGSAMIEGCASSKGKFVIFCFSDGSSDPRDIKKIYNKLQEYDFAYCSRYSKNAKSYDDSLLTYIGNRFFSGIGKLFFNLKINDILYTYFGFRKNKFDELTITSKDYRICVEIPILIERKKFRYCDISAVERKRFSGKKNVNEFRDGFLILCKMVIMFFQK